MLGTAFNMIQAYFLLAVTAHLTGLQAGTATINMVNCHIYKNQYKLALEHVNRVPTGTPQLVGLESLDIEKLLYSSEPPTDYLSIKDYNPHPPIKYPFTA